MLSLPSSTKTPIAVTECSSVPVVICTYKQSLLFISLLHLILYQLEKVLVFSPVLSVAKFFSMYLKGFEVYLIIWLRYFLTHNADHFGQVFKEYEDFPFLCFV